MARMVIHAGFHKTGTSTVQRMLKKNRRILSRECLVFDHSHMPSVSENARSYSVSRDLLDLLAFTYELAEFLERFKGKLERNVCLSSENLLGHMPGRRGLKTYDAAPILMKAFVHTVERVMKEPPEMVFYFSTRDAETWLKSCHSQHLRAVRMTMTTERYKELFAESAHLGRIIDMVRLAVKPHRVETARLEEIGTLPLGPVTPILDLLDISPALRDKLQPVPVTNQALPEELVQEFLDINQSEMSWKDVPVAKQAARDRWALTQDNSEKDLSHDG